MQHEPAFWVAIAFLMFVALLIYFKLPSMIAGVLDSRADKIKNDLDEAEALLMEAQDLLANYQKKQRDAAGEVAVIRANAVEEAKRLAEHGEERLAGHLERREKLGGGELGHPRAALPQRRAQRRSVQRRQQLRRGRRRRRCRPR